MNALIKSLLGFRDGQSAVLSTCAYDLLRDRISMALEKRADLVMPTAQPAEMPSLAGIDRPIGSEESQPILDLPKADQPAMQDIALEPEGWKSLADSAPISGSRSPILPSIDDAKRQFSIPSIEPDDLRSALLSATRETTTDFDTSGLLLSEVNFRSRTRYKPFEPESPLSRYPKKIRFDWFVLHDMPRLPYSVFYDARTVATYKPSSSLLSYYTSYIHELLINRRHDLPVALSLESSFNGLRRANALSVIHFLRQGFINGPLNEAISDITVDDIVYTVSEKQPGQLMIAAPSLSEGAALPTGSRLRLEDLRDKAFDRVENFIGSARSILGPVVPYTSREWIADVNATMNAMVSSIRSYKQAAINKAIEEYRPYITLANAYATLRDPDIRGGSLPPFELIDEYLRVSQTLNERYPVTYSKVYLSDINYDYLGEFGAVIFKHNIGAIDDDDEIFPGHGAVFFRTEVPSVDTMRLPKELKHLNVDNILEGADEYINVRSERTMQPLADDVKKIYDVLKPLFEKWVSDIKDGKLFDNETIAEATKKLLSDMKYSSADAVADLKRGLGNNEDMQKAIGSLKQLGISEDTAYKIILQHSYYKFTTLMLFQYDIHGVNCWFDCMHIPANFATSDNMDSVALSVNSSLLSYLRTIIAGDTIAYRGGYLTNSRATGDVVYFLRDMHDRAEYLLYKYDYQAKKAVLEKILSHHWPDTFNSIKRYAQIDDLPLRWRGAGIDIDLSNLRVNSIADEDTVRNDIEIEENRLRAAINELERLAPGGEAIADADKDATPEERDLLKRLFTDYEIATFPDASVRYRNAMKTKIASSYRYSRLAEMKFFVINKELIYNLLRKFESDGVVDPEIESQVNAIWKNLSEMEKKGSPDLIDELNIWGQYVACTKLLRLIGYLKKLEIPDELKIAHSGFDILKGVMNELGLPPAYYRFYAAHKDMFNAYSYDSLDVTRILSKAENADAIPPAVREEMLLNGIRNDVIETLSEHPERIYDIQRVLSNKAPHARTIWDMYMTFGESLINHDVGTPADVQKMLISQLPGGYFEVFKDWLRHAPITDIIALMLGVSLPAVGLFAMAFGKPLFGGLLMAGGLGALLLGRSPVHLYMLNRPLVLKAPT